VRTPGEVDVTTGVDNCRENLQPKAIGQRRPFETAKALATVTGHAVGGAGGRNVRWQ
jgi:hypothetical protein